MITKRTYARIGLIGNPSDGFYGKTISSCITNFYATASLEKSERLNMIPHRLFDPLSFDSIEALERESRRDGYYGGIRLIYATCSRLSRYCRDNSIKLNGDNYTISYDTNIPRQVGLGGSSAIVVSLLNALVEFYGLTDRQIPMVMRPQLVLSVETEELGIKAGLQDRVIQTYGGTVYMNFDKKIIDQLGHGVYEKLDSVLLPNFFLAYMEGSGKDSGKMHNEVRFRFAQNDRKIVDAMATFASFAEEGRQALEAEDHRHFGELMNSNFDLRRRIYGDKAIGRENLRMIEIGRDLGAPVKFPGSGGAVIGIFEDEKHWKKIQTEYLNHGYRCEKVHIDN